MTRTSKLGAASKDKEKDRKKDSKGRSAFTGAMNTQKSEYDSMFESRDGKTYRRPKPLVSQEMKELALKRKALIDEKQKLRKENVEKNQQQDTSVSKSNIDTNLKESSKDKSSDSVKVDPSQAGIGMTSEMDASEDEQAKRKRAKQLLRRQLRVEDPAEQVPITLTETHCKVILHIPSMIVPPDDEEVLRKQKEVNQRYNAVSLSDAALGEQEGG